MNVERSRERRVRSWADSRAKAVVVQRRAVLAGSRGALEGDSWSRCPVSGSEVRCEAAS